MYYKTGTGTVTILPPYFFRWLASSDVKPYLGLEKTLDKSLACGAAYIALPTHRSPQ